LETGRVRWSFVSVEAGRGGGLDDGGLVFADLGGQEGPVGAVGSGVGGGSG
jgi:hypothetical protein